MRFAFIAKHRGIWPVAWLCEALDVSRSGYRYYVSQAVLQHRKGAAGSVARVSAPEIEEAVLARRG